MPGVPFWFISSIRANLEKKCVSLVMFFTHPLTLIWSNNYIWELINARRSLSHSSLGHFMQIFWWQTQHKEQSDNTGPIKIINKSRAFYGRAARGGIYSVNPLALLINPEQRDSFNYSNKLCFLIMTLKAPKIKRTLAEARIYHNDDNLAHFAPSAPSSSG